MHEITDLETAQRTDDREAARIQMKPWTELSEKHATNVTLLRSENMTWPLLPGCTGPCQQGRSQCSTPDACRLHDDEDARPGAGAGVLIWPAVTALCLFAALAAVHFWRAA